MSIAEGGMLADVLAASGGDADGCRLLDQLWLRTILIDQMRRVRRNERTEYRGRAERILAMLDP
jgi:hypothetical protein